MANLEYNYLEEEATDDDLYLDIEDPLSLKRNIKGISDTSPSLEKYAKFPYHIKLKKEVGLTDVVKEHVLPFLPAKSLCRFRAVSKDWNQWINNPFLAHKQTTQFKDISGLLCQSPGSDPTFISFNQEAYGIPSPSFKFLPESVRIRTTSNGLVCCQSHLEGYFGDPGYYICNPVTMEWKLLPRPNLMHGPETAVALAFEPATLNFAANYELVCAVPDTLDDVSVLHFEIYSSRSSTWRISETICCEPDVLKLSGNGFYMKDFLWWKAKSGAILAFDLKDEQYGIMPLPASSGEDGALTEMHGEVCYLLPQIQDGECTIGLYGNLDMSLKDVIPLTTEIVGETFSHCQVLTCINDDTLIILVPSKVIAYHIKAEQVDLLSKVSNEGFENCLPYINNLVAVLHEPDLSPCDLTYSVNGR